MADASPTVLDGGGLWGASLRIFAALPSTNAWLLDHAADARHGDAVRALHQTAGRGRFNRNWISPADRGLALSVLIGAAGITPETVTLFTPATALAVAEALAERGLPAMVKWPNDVLVRGRKIAGILAERDQRSGAIVIGIGLNVNLTPGDFAAQPLLHPATSVFIETGVPDDPGPLATRVLHHLEQQLHPESLAQPRALWEQWARRDALHGLRIRVATAIETLEGLYLGTAHDGALRLRTDDGQDHVLFTGDVSATRTAPPQTR